MFVKKLEIEAFREVITPTGLWQIQGDVELSTDNKKSPLSVTWMHQKSHQWEVVHQENFKVLERMR